MIGRVQAIAKGGAGIIRETDKTVFIPGVISGETVEYTTVGRWQSAWQGKLQRVIEASPRRVDPPCPHFHECGGCNLQHMSYEEQLRSKSEILLTNLKKIAGLAIPDPPEILASPPWRYRSKSEFQVRDGVGGFFRKGSHRVVALDECRLLPEVMERFFLDQRRVLRDYPDAQLRVISNGREIAARLETPEGRGAWFSRERSLRFEISAYAYQLGPDHFIQANLFQLQPMVSLLEKVLNDMNPTVAADLFCGCGFFTLPLAGRCPSVLALESDKTNLTALKVNLEINRIMTVRAVQADVLRTDLPPAGLYVVDPPRGGLSARVIAAMAGSQAQTVVYFSCDSATFARDLRLFIQNGFKLDELKLIDNFPHSDHFEIGSVLKKK